MHRACDSTGLIRFTDDDSAALVRELRRQPGKDIWIRGGASLAQQLMAEGLVDTYYLSIIPTLLGDGVRLFGGALPRQDLRLMKTQSYNGIVDVVYTRR